MRTAVNQCPCCEKRNAVLDNGAIIKHVYTEINVSVHCPDCGYSWYIIYTPDRTEERE